MTSTPEYGSDAFLCQQVVQQIDRASSGQKQVYKTEFNKLCHLVYEQLKEEDYDVGLPVYWYQYGIVVWNPERYPLDFHSQDRGTVIHAQNGIDSLFDVSDDLRQAIVQTAHRVASNYGLSFGTETVKDDSYDRHAPTSFIHEFNEFRAVLEPMEASQRSLTSFTTNEGASESEGRIDALRPSFEALVESYPQETYSTAYREFRQWDSIARQLAKNDQIPALKQFTNAFWEMFSRVELRVQHNENIPAETRARWIRKRDSIRDDFADTIREYRETARADRTRTHQLAALADEYSEAVRRLARDISQ